MATNPPYLVLKPRVGTAEGRAWLAVAKMKADTGLFSLPWHEATQGTLLARIQKELHPLLFCYDEAKRTGSPTLKDCVRYTFKSQFSYHQKQLWMATHGPPVKACLGVGPSGTIYVAHTTRLHVFVNGRRTGSCAFMAGYPPPEFRGLAVYPDGNLVAIQTSAPVRIIGPSGDSVISSFQNPGGSANCSGVAIDLQDNLVIADSHADKIQVISPQGNFIRSFGCSGDGVGELKKPVGVAVDGEGNVIVVEADNSRIQVFDPHGNSLRIIGSPGAGDGQLSNPSGISVDWNGKIVVTDAGNDRVSIFSPQGEFLMHVGVGRLKEPSVAVIDRNGNLAIADSLDQVQIFEPAFK